MLSDILNKEIDMQEKLEGMLSQLKETLQITQEIISEAADTDKELRELKKDYETMKQWHDMIVPKIEEKDKKITEQANYIGKLEDEIISLTAKLTSYQGTTEFKTARITELQKVISESEQKAKEAKLALDKIK